MFKKKIYYLLSLFCFLNSFSLIAQVYSTAENITKGTRLQNHNITCIAQDMDGFLWVGTNLGLYRYDGYQFLDFSVNTTPSILNNNIRSLLIDGAHLWIGSMGGINIINTVDKSMVNLTSNSNIELSIPANFISKIHKDSQNEIWVGHNSGYLSHYKGTQKVANYKLVEKVNDYKVFNFFEIEKQSFVVQLINVKNKSTKIIAVHIKDNQLIKKDLIETEDRVMLFKMKNELLLIINNEVKYFDFAAQVFLSKNVFIEQTENFYGLPYVENNNKVYIGTNKSKFYCIDIIDSFKVSEIELGIDEKFVNSFFVDKTGLLWVGATNGLYKFKKSISLFEGNNTIYFRAQGVENKLWLGTLEGLLRDDTVINQFQKFYPYVGFVSNAFNSSSYLKINRNTLFLGTQNGISSFNPTNLLTKKTNLNLNITGVSWYNSKKDSTYTLSVNNINLKRIELPYNNAFLSFEFSLSDYLNPKKNSFKYKFKGLHSNWRILNKTNSLTFSHLPPGDYVLEVMAATNYGKWNNQQLSIPIIVHQIIYKQWWFIFIMVVLLFSVAFLVRKYEIYHIKEMEKLRLRIARDLHDELGSVLTGIAIRSELINENIDENKRNEFLNEMAVQSRAAVDTLGDLVWAIDSRNNGLQNLMDRIENVLFQLLSPKKITYTFNCFNTKKAIVLNQEYRQHVFLIFKEALTNVIKHSNATEVNVSFTKEKQQLKLTIKDNGTKFNKNVNNLNGNGLANMKTRAEKINGSIQFIHKEGFTVVLLFECIK